MQICVMRYCLEVERSRKSFPGWIQKLWREGRISSIRNMVELGVPKEKILIKYTLAEYEDAKRSGENSGSFYMDLPL